MYRIESRVKEKPPDEPDGQTFACMGLRFDGNWGAGDAARLCIQGVPAPTSTINFIVDLELVAILSVERSDIFS